MKFAPFRPDGRRRRRAVPRLACAARAADPRLFFLVVSTRAPHASDNVRAARMASAFTLRCYCCPGQYVTGYATTAAAVAAAAAGRRAYVSSSRIRFQIGNSNVTCLFFKLQTFFCKRFFFPLVFSSLIFLIF